VTRTEHDGSVTVLADRYQGLRLNSPNDSVVRSDGSVWFTDPDFGITSDYEGHRAEGEIGACNVYRIDSAGGAVQLVADGFTGPNGIVFSPDERQLFVADSRARHIRVLDVHEDGTLSDGKVFAEAPNSSFDNIRFDDGGGPRRSATASTATTRTARSSAASWSRSRSPTSPSAGRRTTGSSSPPPPPCTRSSWR